MPQGASFFDQTYFPYLDGYAFVNAIRGRGDWDAVDAVWAAQPVSTEQILHPELYPDELPVAIELPDVATAARMARRPEFAESSLTDRCLAARILAGEFVDGDTIRVDHQGKSFVLIRMPRPEAPVEAVEAEGMEE